MIRAFLGTVKHRLHAARIGPADALPAPGGRADNLSARDCPQFRQSPTELSQRTRDCNGAARVADEIGLSAHGSGWYGVWLAGRTAAVARAGEAGRATQLIGHQLCLDSARARQS